MEEVRRPLLSRTWVQSLALLLASIVGFGSAVGGTPVWDDYRVLGAAAAFGSPRQVFSTNLFATTGGDGAVYYRPLVTLSYWCEINLFETAPNVGMHVTNLFWHGAAAILLLRALRRLLEVDEHRASTANLACFAATLAWTLMPIKAENVAWITGRGDVMGTVFLLLGVEALAHVRTPPRRAACVALFTALALLCKEATVAAPGLFGGLLIAQDFRDHGPSSVMAQARRLIRRPEWMASLAIVIVYLILRSILLPVATGGTNMFRHFTVADKAQLFLETSGLAFTTLATPWRAQLLRAPIAFHPDLRLVHDIPAMIVVGSLGWVLGAWVFWKRPAFRAAVGWTFALLLPVSNLVVIPLESRLSDRFLYLPSLGLALGVAVGITRLKPRIGAWVGVSTLVAAGILGFRAHERSTLFLSSDALFTWELQNGNRALAVLSNAAFEANREHRYRASRDLHLALAQRYTELNYTGAGYESVVAGLRNQVLATGDAYPPAARSLEQLARAAMEERDEKIILRFDNGVAFEVETGSEAAKRFYKKFGLELRSALALLLARRGDVEGLVIATDNVKTCSNCNDVLMSAAEVAVASVQPDIAEEMAQRARAATPQRETVLRLARIQRRMLQSSSPHALTLASFAGGAFQPTCAKSGSVEDLESASDELRSIVVAACWLAPDRARALELVGGDRSRLEGFGASVEELRWAAEKRANLALDALESK